MMKVSDILKSGHRVQTEWYQLAYSMGVDRDPGISVIVGKRFGNAVKRNRIKRRFREVIRKEYVPYTVHPDMVIIPRKRSMEERFSILQESFRRTLREIL